MFQTVSLFDIAIVGDQPDHVLNALGVSAQEVPHRLIFVNAWDLWRGFAVRKARERLRHESMIVLAGSRPAARLIRLGTGVSVPVFSRFHTVVRCLTGAEARNARVFLLGRRIEHLKRVEANFHATFPALQVAGRSVVAPNAAESVQIGIRKSDPQYVLAGISGRWAERWIATNFQSFGSALTINAFEVFQRMVGEKRRLRPWRILRAPVYLVLFVALLVHRIRLRRGNV